MEDEEGDEVLLIDLGGGGGAVDFIVESCDVSAGCKAGERIDGDDGLQYEKGHWVS